MKENTHEWGKVVAMAIVALVQIVLFGGSVYLMYLLGRALLKYIGA